MVPWRLAAESPIRREMVRLAIPGGVPGNDLPALLAEEAVLVEDVAEVGDLCVSASQSEARAGVVAIVVELVRNSGDAGALLQQGPDQVKVVRTGQTDTLVNATHLQERALLE